MTLQPPAPVASDATSGARAISEVGPFVGSTSFAVGSRLVFVSADGTWGHPPD